MQAVEPQRIVSFNSPCGIYLASGCSVLDAYYGLSHAEYITLHVSCSDLGNQNLPNLVNFDKSLYEIYDTEVREDAAAAIMHIHDRILKTPIARIEFINVDDPNISPEELLPLTSYYYPAFGLCWDGQKYLFPPEGLVNYRTKSMVVSPGVQLPYWETLSRDYGFVTAYSGSPDQTLS